jgi:3',5'-cyclic AMP phosphodiesterase CpdA
MFVLAHLSDVHLDTPMRPRPAELVNKRLLGFVNWQLRRRPHHLRSVVDTLVADMRAAAPDHIVVGGDLVNISLASEFAAARVWLHDLGKPADITLVPGNHDAYVRAAIGEAERSWGAYMGDGEAPTGRGGFPFVRRRGPLALVGVSTAVPSGPFEAIGTVGKDQLQRLADALARLMNEPLFRVLVIHHPPISTTKQHHKRLTDAAEVREVLKTYGVDLVIHGHEHVRSLVWIEGPAAHIPVFGVPSASASAGDTYPGGYNLYRIDGGPNAWRCEAISRGLTADGRVTELQRRVVSAER